MAAMNWSEDLPTTSSTLFPSSEPPIPAVPMAFMLMNRAPLRDLRPSLMTAVAREEELEATIVALGNRCALESHPTWF